MNDQRFSNDKKQGFVDHVNKFIEIIDHTNEQLLKKKRGLSMNRKNPELTKFWINCIEDASNSLGMSLSNVDKGDILKGLSCLIYYLYFCREEDPMIDTIESMSL